MLLFARILFLCFCTFLPYWLPSFHAVLTESLLLPDAFWVMGTAGFGLGLIIVLLDVFFKRFTVRAILATFLGLILGLVAHHWLMKSLSFFVASEAVLSQVALITAVVLTYLAIIAILRGQDEFAMMIPFVKLDAKDSGEELILLDTSVIIDGRIADMCETHFLPGKLIVPRFVLKELQLISDSSDPLKRNRGRRGLDVLNVIKANKNIAVQINEMDFPEFATVDAKLVKMAQVTNAKVFTNDFNLNKVAELQGVKVLNINDLANALKPVVMPGELMQVKILKEGKENDQGVAYLDDGTMVVVDNGRRVIGKTLNVSITSVLQTQAGRMIFAKLSDEGKYNNDRGGRRKQTQDNRK